VLCIIVVFGVCYEDSNVPLVAAEMDQDVPDSVDFQANDEDDLRLRNLASRLRADLKQILLFSTSDCQVGCSQCCIHFNILNSSTILQESRCRLACMLHVIEHVQICL